MYAGAGETSFEELDIQKRFLKMLLLRIRNFIPTEANIFESSLQ